MTVTSQRTPTQATPFSLYCRKHEIDRSAQKQIRAALRKEGHRDPYNLKNPVVMAIIKSKWTSIRAARSGQ